MHERVRADQEVSDQVLTDRDARAALVAWEGLDRAAVGTGELPRLARPILAPGMPSCAQGLSA